MESAWRSYHICISWFQEISLSICSQEVYHVESVIKQGAFDLTNIFFLFLANLGPSRTGQENSQRWSGHYQSQWKNVYVFHDWLVKLGTKRYMMLHPKPSCNCILLCLCLLQFARIIPTCLQTVTNYSPSGSKYWNGVPCELERRIYLQNISHASPNTFQKTQFLLWSWIVSLVSL